MAHSGDLEQGAHVNRDFVIEAALASRRHHQLLAKPFELEAAVGGGATAHAQLLLQHLEGEPEFGTPCQTRLNEQPARLLGLAIDHQALTAELSGAGAAGDLRPRDLRPPDLRPRGGRRRRHGQGGQCRRWQGGQCRHLDRGCWPQGRRGQQVKEPGRRSHRVCSH